MKEDESQELHTWDGMFIYFMRKFLTAGPDEFYSYQAEAKEILSAYEEALNGED